MGRATSGDMTNTFFSEVVKLRGRIYEIRELSAAKYDKTVKQATEEIEEDGVKREDFNDEKHRRLLIDLCVTIGSKVKKDADGKLHLTDGKPIDLEEYRSEAGNRVWRSLVTRTLKMNLDEEPEEEIVELEGEVSAEPVTAST